VTLCFAKKPRAAPPPCVATLRVLPSFIWRDLPGAAAGAAPGSAHRSPALRALAPASAGVARARSEP